MQKLVALAEFGVDQHGRQQAEARQQPRSGPGMDPERDQQAAPQLDGYGERQQRFGHAEALRVSRRTGITPELGQPLVNEDRGQQQPADQQHSGVQRAFA